MWAKILVHASLYGAPQWGWSPSGWGMFYCWINATFRSTFVRTNEIFMLRVEPFLGGTEKALTEPWSWPKYPRVVPPSPSRLKWPSLLLHNSSLKNSKAGAMKDFFWVFYLVPNFKLIWSPYLLLVLSILYLCLRYITHNSLSIKDYKLELENN